MKKLFQSKKKIRIFLVNCLLAIGLSEIESRQVQAQSKLVWQYADSFRAKSAPVIWETAPESEKSDQSETSWEVYPETQERDKKTKKIVWELIEVENDAAIPPLETLSDFKITSPTSMEEAEGLLDIIPLQSNDFKYLLDLSYAVPTALVLSQEEWRLISSTISPFKYENRAANQNNVIQLDYGLSDTLQISGFYSQADDPINVSITGLEVRPGNFWEVFGAAARWKFLTNKNWSLALNSSLESWTVGSGGGDFASKNSSSEFSPNIFNNSGTRVETQNLVGSIALPLTWHPNKKWQFTFTPGISFLPSSQGQEQGGAGKFYGTNPYVSGGLLWHPVPEIGLTASIAQPIGTGNNSFDKNLEYSRVPIISGGLSWHLNPRIALETQLTNGFGATPATALLTLPSENRLGYTAKLILTPNAADTPQPPLSSRQSFLAWRINSKHTLLHLPNQYRQDRIRITNQRQHLATLSNIFQLEFHRSQSNNAAQIANKHNFI